MIFGFLKHAMLNPLFNRRRGSQEWGGDPLSRHKNISHINISSSLLITCARGLPDVSQLIRFRRIFESLLLLSSGTRPCGQCTLNRNKLRSGYKFCVQNSFFSEASSTISLENFLWGLMMSLPRSLVPRVPLHGLTSQPLLSSFTAGRANLLFWK